MMFSITPDQQSLLITVSVVAYLVLATMAFIVVVTHE